MATETTLNVSGMSCAGCENALRQALTRLDGVTVVEPDHVTGEVKLHFDAGLVDIDTIKASVRTAGFMAVFVGSTYHIGPKSNSHSMLSKPNPAFSMALMSSSIGPLLTKPWRS